MDRFLYRKSQRVSSEKDFSRVLGHRCVVRRGNLRLCAAPNEVQIPRFGVSVGKACGGAVERNRLKRLAREVFRTHQHEVRAGTDYILIFSPQKKKVQGNNKASRQAFRIGYKELETVMLEMIRAVESRVD